MDADLLDISRAYRRRKGPRDKQEARDDLLDLYEYYTGADLETPKLKVGWADRAMARSAGFAARTVSNLLGLGPLKHPASLLARQGIQRSRETAKLISKVRDDRDSLEELM